MSSESKIQSRPDTKPLLDEPADDAAPSPAETRRLLLELQVHQVELELQNEELRLSRAAVEEGLARYTELYDFAPVGYFTFFRDGSIRELNLPGARLLGTERERVLGRPLNGFLGPEQRKAFASWLEDIFSGAAPKGHVTTLLGRDKIPRAVEFSASVSLSGALARAIVVDVTARLELEEQLRQSQKLDTIGQLAGGIAHDFNNILAAMMLNLDCLEREQPLPASCAPALVDLQSLAKRATDLTRQLLQFSRRQTLERREIELNVTVRRLLEMLQRVLGEQIVYVWKEGNHALPVSADVAQIEQAIVNLCLNARDAMAGAGTLTLETGSVEFDGTHTLENPHARTGPFAWVSVSDTGSGMTKEVSGRVFEPFFTTKALGKGTGLGLSSTLGVIEQHHGWITLESESGKGTRFRFYVPLSTTASRTTPSTLPPPGEAQSEQTILLVEDEKILLAVCTRALRSLGYRVLSAQDGAMGFQVWSQHAAEIDLLLTDMRMPGEMNGLELAKRIWMTSPTLQVVIMSGHSSEALHEGPAGTAGYTFLQKPFNSNVLAKVVGQALARALRRSGG
jgi:PAS domain S-box-containing protein